MKKSFKKNNITFENRGNGKIKFRADKGYEPNYYKNGPETDVDINNAIPLIINFIKLIINALLKK